MRFDVDELLKSNGNVLPSGNYYLESSRGTLANFWHDRLVVSRVTVSGFEDQEKPCYLSLMMSESQLKTIIQNRHLFDVELVNAAHLLLDDYDSLVLE